MQWIRALFVLAALAGSAHAATIDVLQPDPGGLWAVTPQLTLADGQAEAYMPLLVETRS